jgi:hypothetical protein
MNERITPERLEELSSFPVLDVFDDPEFWQWIDDATDALKAAAARIRAMEVALRPFVQLITEDNFPEYSYSDHEPLGPCLPLDGDALTLGHARAARKVLEDE